MLIPNVSLKIKIEAPVGVLFFNPRLIGIFNPLNPPYQGDFKRQRVGFPKYLSNSRYT